MAHQWLKEDLTDEEIAPILHYEYPAAKMEAWPVNTIRTRKPDDESVIREMHYDNLPEL